MTEPPYLSPKDRADLSRRGFSEDLINLTDDTIGALSGKLTEQQEDQAVLDWVSMTARKDADLTPQDLERIEAARQKRMRKARKQGGKDAE